MKKFRLSSEMEHPNVRYGPTKWAKDVSNVDNGPLLDSSTSRLKGPNPGDPERADDMVVLFFKGELINGSRERRKWENETQLHQTSSWKVPAHFPVDPVDYPSLGTFRTCKMKDIQKRSRLWAALSTLLDCLSNEAVTDFIFCQIQMNRRCSEKNGVC